MSLIDTTELEQQLAAMRARIEDLEEDDESPPPDPEPPDPPPAPEPPKGNGKLELVGPDDWDPANTDHVTNPNPGSHEFFTSMLAHPGLWWADSLRPYSDDPAKWDRYYGRRMHGGSGKASANPSVEFDPAQDAAKQMFEDGVKALPHKQQTRIKWPAIGPWRKTSQPNDMVTVVWEYKLSPTGHRGGKQFQISDDDEDLHFEYKTPFGYSDGPTCDRTEASDWGLTPAARVYETLHVGGRGIKDLLVRGSGDPSAPDYCAGENRCPPQPNLPHRNPKANYDLDEHLSGNAYLVSHKSGWIRVYVTFDWRAEAMGEWKVWMHVEDERTPLTLVIGLEGDGFPLAYLHNSIGSFWLEFNNSSSINKCASHLWVRNVLVVKDWMPAPPL